VFLFLVYFSKRLPFSDSLICIRNMEVTTNGRELFNACTSGDLANVTELLDQGVDVNWTYTPFRRTALILACKNGHVEIAKLLLNRGAEINTQDIVGCTALMAASTSGHVAIIQCLLGKAAKVNIQDGNGWTALIWAANYFQTECALLLLKKGADVSIKDKFGRTAKDYSKKAADLLQNKVCVVVTIRFRLPT
jgi:ankyrin repeat protein